MGNRIDVCFEQLRNRRMKGFIPYICAGDPSLTATVEIVHSLEDAGADLIELGVPFSDPLADGIVNQLAAQRALAAGATMDGVLKSVREIRERSQIPLVLYTYLNPILQRGWTEFHRAAADAGVDGLLILDLPPEEDLPDGEGELHHIRLIAPTTSPDRRAMIATSARGFIYYVSRTGVTGRGEKMGKSLSDEVSAIRKETDLPVAVGFGISNPQQAGEVASVADAVVVGSAIVEKVDEHGDDPNLAHEIGDFVRPFAAATKSLRS